MAKFPIKEWRNLFLAGLSNPQLFGSVSDAVAFPEGTEVGANDINQSAKMLGYLMGRMIPRHLAKLPVAYLYNGVRLPKLPEWNKETHPYAVIGVRDNSYYLIVSSIELGAFAKGQGTFIAEENGQVWIGGTYSNEYICTEGMWTEIKGTDAKYFFYSTIWANYSVYFHVDSRGGELAGTLYLPESEPVLVF